MLKGIYAITPNDLEERELLIKISSLFDLNIPIIQLREKNRTFEEKYYLAKKIINLRGNHVTKIIINDDPVLAKMVNADGVHLGISDPSYQSARETLGEDSIIGISCQNNLKIAIEAQQVGANYVAFGSLFNSKTKLDASLCSTKELKNLVKNIRIPSVAIGGINFNNIGQLAISKVDLIATSSGLFEGDIKKNYISLFNIYSSSW
tara:strand:- start:1027 stop:1644 length:618 start_codon:yes stop_codon:yes gene_type:complete